MNKKLQFEISDVLWKDVELIKEQADLSSNKDLFREMYSLYRWAMDAICEGKEIGSLKDDNFTPVTSPTLLVCKLRAVERQKK